MFTSGISPTIDDAVVKLYTYLLNYGAEAKPRGMRVKETLGTAIKFDMRFPVVTLAKRKLGYRFMAAEAAWILSGDNRLENIKRYSPFIWEFSDDGFFYQGAYGPRVVDQLTYVCDVLSADNDTRQAVIEVWRPNPRAGRDIPCTLSYQFLQRDGYLHCIQSMRSSDAWLGYAYDCFNATMLAGYIALLLHHREKNGLKGLKIGTHTMLVASNHLYERNWTEAESVVTDYANNLRVMDPEAFDPLQQFTTPQDLISHLRLLADERWDAIPEDAYLRRALMTRRKASYAA